MCHFWTLYVSQDAVCFSLFAIFEPTDPLSGHVVWTVLPCLFMFTNTIAYAFRCQLRKQLYLIAFVDLVPVATEKVSLIQLNTVWNRWKSTLRARSVRVNLNHGKEM